MEAGAADSPITFAGYKVKHPLHRSVMIRLGIREGLTGDAVAKQVIASASSKALALFEELGRSWASVSGLTAGGLTAGGTAGGLAAGTGALAAKATSPDFLQFNSAAVGLEAKDSKEE